MRLAEHVEHTTDVAGMLDRMTAEQWREWCIKDQVEPIGYATQMAAMTNFLLSSYLAPDDTNAETFLPWLKGQTPKQGNREAKNMLSAMLGKPSQGNP